MSRKEKLLAAIRANLHAVRFEDACKVALLLGFVHQGGKGSHRVFKRQGEPAQLNFQNRNSLIPHYQAMQLLTMMNKYEAEL